MSVMNARDARHLFSELLQRAESGETIEITRHGRVVAIVSPPPDGELQWLDRMLDLPPAETGWADEHDRLRNADREIDRDPWT
jgi:prevent-host-death family protein